MINGRLIFRLRQKWKTCLLFLKFDKTSSIVDNGKRLCDSLSLDMNSPSDKNLPKSVDFCGVEVILDLKSDIIEGVLFESVKSKSVVQNIIKNN